MKKLFFAALASLALQTSSQAANYILSNVVNGSSGDILFQDVDDSLLSGTAVAMGYFNNGYSPTFDVGSMSTNIANFTTVSSGLTGTSATFDGAGTGPWAGYIEVAEVDGAIITGGSFPQNQSLFVIAGNTNDLATSTAFALIEIQTIGDDVPNEFTYNAGIGMQTGTVRVGSTGSFNGVTNPFVPGGFNYTTLKLEAIPEPSAALLGLCGGLLLLRRRRNA